MGVSRKKLLNQVAQRNLFKPQTVDGSSEILGNVIDRKGFASASIAVITGDTPSNPTSAIITFKVYHNTENSTSGGVDTGLVITSISGLDAAIQNIITANNDIDLEPFNRYIYLGVTPTFTGGSSPSIDMAAVVTLGDSMTVEPTS